MANVTEVGPDIYRINVEIPGKPVTFSLFLIRDEQPTLVETSYRRVFDEVMEAVATVIDPSTLRHIVIPHFEGDECGGLNHFLEAAPNALPVCSPVGANTSIPDFSIRDPLRVDEETTLDLGQHKLRFLVTPYVHAWDSMLAYDETTGTLFSSDLFLQPGTGPALTDRDISEEMVAYTRAVGLFPSQAHLVAALDKIDALQPVTLACHHGTVKAGQIPAYLRAFREHNVTGLPPADPVHSSIARPPPAAIRPDVSTQGETN
jgi:flavorubredoxin